MYRHQLLQSAAPSTVSYGRRAAAAAVTRHSSTATLHYITTALAALIHNAVVNSLGDNLLVL